MCDSERILDVCLGERMGKPAHLVSGRNVGDNEGSTDKANFDNFLFALRQFYGPCTKPDVSTWAVWMTWGIEAYL